MARTTSQSVHVSGRPIGSRVDISIPRCKSVAYAALHVAGAHGDEWRAYTSTGGYVFSLGWREVQEYAVPPAPLPNPLRDEVSPEQARAILAELHALTSATPGPIAEVPFSLTAPVGTGGGKQESLF